MIQEKLSGILDKIENNAEGIGGLLGIMADPMADGRGLSKDTFTFAIDRISHWHVPDPAKIIEFMLSDPEAYPIMTNITAALGGWALAEFGGMIDPKVAKIGRIVKKGATAAALGNVIGGFIWLPAIVNGTSASSGNSVPASGGVYSV